MASVEINRAGVQYIALSSPSFIITLIATNFGLIKHGFHHRYSLKMALDPADSIILHFVFYNQALVMS